MARTSNLSNFLTDVADAIRTKKGSEEPIAAADFDTEIENLPSGGGDLSEYFNNTVTENTSSSTNYKLLKKAPDLIVSDNVTSLSYLFAKYTGEIMPRVVCNNNVTNMSRMYYSNNSENAVTSIDLSGLDTSNVTDMSYMFGNRKGIIELNLNNFSAASLSEMGARGAYGMFNNCSSLRKIDLSNFNPAKAIDVRSMFYYCSYLEEIDLDKWDLATKVSSTYYSSIFYNCGSSLTNGAVTKVYVKDQAAQDWILALSSSHRPSTWTTDNVIIAGSEADLRNA